MISASEFRFDGGELAREFPDIPLTGGPVRELIEYVHVVAPGNSCNNPLHKFAFRSGFGERTHALQIAWRKPELAPIVRISG